MKKHSPVGRVRYGDETEFLPTVQKLFPEPVQQAIINKAVVRIEFPLYILFVEYFSVKNSVFSKGYQTTIFIQFLIRLQKLRQGMIVRQVVVVEHPYKVTITLRLRCDQAPLKPSG